MSNTFRVEPDFFEEFLNEDSFEVRRNRRAAGRYRRSRRTVRPANDTIQTDQLDMGLTSDVRDWEPGPKIFI